MNTLTPIVSNQVTGISPVDALWVLIQGQTKAVRKELAKRMMEEEQTTKAQQTMVRKSLTKAYDELHTGQARHDARGLFVKQ